MEEVGLVRLVGGAQPGALAEGIGAGHRLFEPRAAAPGQHALDDGEPLGSAIGQVGLGVGLGVLGKEGPGGVTQPEERLVVGIDKVAPVGADAHRPGKSAVRHGGAPLRV